MRRGGLGRGLAALIPGAEESASKGHPGGMVELSVGEVRPNPRQPRKKFPEETLAGLAASIREVGLLQPIVVRRTRFGYELVAGERRLRAARLVGLATVPAIVRDDNNGGAALREALIENIHREDLGPLELAAAFQELSEELGGSHEEVAARLGCSRSHVANTVRLLSLPSTVQRLVADGRLQAGHARALLGLPDAQARSELALRAAAEGFSVRALEELVRTYRAPTAPSGPRPGETAPGIAALQDLLVEALGTRVSVTLGRRGGRIVIHVGSAEELDRIAALVAGDGSTVMAPSDTTVVEPVSA